MAQENVQYITVDKHLQYYLYVPENVNPDTEIFFYAQGSGVEGGKEFVVNYLENNGSNSIVVVPNMSGGYNDLDWEENSVDIAETLQEQYNLNNKNIVSSGWSGGGWGAFKTTIENIKRNPDLEPQILFTLDDVSPTILNSKYHPTDSRDVVMNNGGREALAQNDTVIFMFQANTQGKYYSLKEAAAFDFASAGANVVRVRIQSCGGHEGIFQNFFKKGLIEYTNGLALLPDQYYTYETPIYDEATGNYNWIEIDYEDVKSKEALFNYFNITPSSTSLTGLDGLIDKISNLFYNADSSDGISKMISSNLEYIKDFASQLVTSVKNDNISFVNSISVTGGFGPLMALINECIETYKNATNNLLDSISNQGSAIVSMGQAIADMDMHFRKESEQVNDSIIFDPSSKEEGND